MVKTTLTPTRFAVAPNYNYSLTQARANFREYL